MLRYHVTLLYAVTGREEFLTEAVFFWNQRKIRCLPKILGLRLRKVKFIATM